MDNLLYQVFSCKTYNTSNHVLKEKTTNLTSNVWGAFYNMIPRTKNPKYIMIEDGVPYVCIPQKLIMSCVHCSESTVKRAIRKLKELGLLIVKTIRSHASTRNYYRIPLDILKNLIAGDPNKTDQDKVVDRGQNDPVHTGNYVLNTDKKNEILDATVPTITLTPEQAEEVQQQMAGSWIEAVNNAIRDNKPTAPDQDILIAAPAEASAERSSENTCLSMGIDRVRAVGGVLEKMAGVYKNSLNKISKIPLPPLIQRKQDIDHSTIAGDIKRIYKQILDIMGENGIRFINSYIETGKIKIVYNNVKCKQMAIIEDDFTRDYIERIYWELFNKLQIPISG